MVKRYYESFYSSRSLVNPLSVVKQPYPHVSSSGIHISQGTVITNPQFEVVSLEPLEVLEWILGKQQKLCANSLSKNMPAFLKEFLHLRMQLYFVAHARPTYSLSGVSRAFFSALLA